MQVDKLLSASISTNTRSSYQSGLSSFHKFRSQFNHDSVWPPPLTQVVDYVSYLSCIGQAWSTARSYVSAISFHCKMQNLEDVTKNFVIVKLLEGMKRLRKPSDSRLPIKPALLSRILQVLPSVCFNQYESWLFKASYSLAFYGFFRIGELALSTGNSINSILQVSDIQFDKDCTRILVHVRGSKTDQLGKGATLYIGQVNNITCPVSNVGKFLSIRPKVQGPLLCHANGQPLTRYQFSQVLDKVLKLVGVEGRYRAHSFRIGAATAAFEQGCLEEIIMEAGRWKSKSYKSYIRCPLST